MEPLAVIASLFSLALGGALGWLSRNEIALSRERKARERARADDDPEMRRARELVHRAAVEEFPELARR